MMHNTGVDIPRTSLQKQADGAGHLSLQQVSCHSNEITVNVGVIRPTDDGMAGEIRGEATQIIAVIHGQHVCLRIGDFRKFRPPVLAKSIFENRASVTLPVVPNPLARDHRMMQLAGFQIIHGLFTRRGDAAWQYFQVWRIHLPLPYAMLCRGSGVSVRAVDTDSIPRHTGLCRHRLSHTLDNLIRKANQITAYQEDAAIPVIHRHRPGLQPLSDCGGMPVEKWAITIKLHTDAWGDVAFAKSELHDCFLPVAVVTGLPFEQPPCFDLRR